MTGWTTLSVIWMTFIGGVAGFCLAMALCTAKQARADRDEQQEATDHDDL